MRVRVWAAAAAAVCAACSVASAQPAPPQAGGSSGAGDVNLTPRRLVLSGRQRAGEVVVFNRGNAPAVYRVELEDLAMTPQGALESLDKVDPAVRARHRSAKDRLRYSPRRIELAPGTSQVIRVLARSAPGEAAGEARSHLVVTAVPTQGAGLDVATPSRRAPANCGCGSRQCSASPSRSSRGAANRLRPSASPTPG
jgi:P pilus assembly chaperone PapD